MTAAVRHASARTSSLPQTQNTAPVLEFNCLYTYDVRRKSKRWQDGFLRYHTFNKRIMVYDVPRNYIGDSHWTGDSEVADGDEVTLDKSGVLVQVAEAVGRTETDLTELHSGRKKSGAGRGSSAPGVGPRTPAARTSNVIAARSPNQLKHRSLNALLGVSKGPIGKATLPDKSPFELRQAHGENGQGEEVRMSKRQRVEHLTAPSMTRASMTLNRAAQQPPACVPTADTANTRKQTVPQQNHQNPKVQEFIDLEDDEPEFLIGSSNNSHPVVSPPSKQGRTQPAHQALSSVSAFRTPTTSPKQMASPKRQMDAAVDNGLFTVENRSAVPVNSGNHGPLSRSDVQRDAASARTYGNAQQPRPSAMDKQSRKRSGSTLRVAASVPKKKKRLLCQEQLISNPKAISSLVTAMDADGLLDTAWGYEKGVQPRAKTQPQLFEERLAGISETKPRTLHKDDLDIGGRSNHGTSDDDNDGNDSNAAFSVQKKRQRTLHNANARPLAELDQSAPSAQDRGLIGSPARPQPTKRTSSGTETKESRIALSTKCRTDNLDKGATIANASELGTLSPPRKPPRRYEHIISGREIRASAQPWSEQTTSAEPEPAPWSENMNVEHRATELPIKPEAHKQTQLSRPEQEERMHPLPAKDSGDAHYTPPDLDITKASGATPRQKRVPPMRPALSPPPAARPPAGNPTLGTSSLKSTSRAPPQKPFRAPISLRTTASGTAAVMLDRPFQPPRPSAAATMATESAGALAADPWSREAFDLFDWRPPGWDDEQWRIVAVSEGV